MKGTSGITCEITSGNASERIQEKTSLSTFSNTYESTSGRPFIQKKSRILETTNLLACADGNTNTPPKK